MICPKCGEVNSSNFLFCGMCGTILEPARRASATIPPPAGAVPAPPPRVAESAALPDAPIAAPPARSAPEVPPVTRSVPPISGPSLLGLDSSSPGQSSELDDLRDRAFSGLASYGRPEEPKSAGREILLTVVLLAALAGAGWWTYKNYIHVSGGNKPVAAAPVDETANLPAEATPSRRVEKPEAEKPEVKTTPPSETPPDPAPASSAGKAAPPEVTPAAEETPEEAPKAAAPTPIPARHEVSPTRVPAAKPAPPVDSGDAFFRRGETYLYGRNGTEDCGNALKFLKMASDKQHSKARSMMGTMYATGHCVPRDLPSSYRWFALALQADPNNTVLEKNLGAVWNQMTPPERQMATKRQ